MNQETDFIVTHFKLPVGFKVPQYFIKQMNRDFQSLRQPNHWAREARIISLPMTEPTDYISVLLKLARFVI
jgi:hypothetical protein